MKWEEEYKNTNSDLNEPKKAYKPSSMVIYGGGSNITDKSLLQKHKAKVLNSRTL